MNLKFTRKFIFFALLFAMLSTPIITNATTRLITVQSNSFNPSSLNVNVGDTVHFQWLSGNHTTTCDPGTLPGTSYPAGFSGWDSPMNSGTTDYYVPIAHSGTYEYGCIPHFGGGMAGTIEAGTGYKYWMGVFGGGDGFSWTDALNWSEGTVPSTADSVMLDNSFITFTYIVSLPSGTTTTQVAKIVIQPTLPNYIYLTLPVTNTATASALTLGNGSGSPYDFVINKHGVFNYQTGATSGTPYSMVNSVDSIQLLDSGVWNHNCRVGQTGIVTKLSKAANTRLGIFKYDMLTTSFASIQFQNITYGSLILSGFSSGAPYPYKKYITTGSGACNVRGNFYMDEYCYDSTTMTNNLNVAGNFTMFGKMVYAPVASPRTLVFNGTAVTGIQNITCDGILASSSQISSRVNFNNPAGFYITNPLYVDSVTMTTGNINSAPGAWLGVGYDASNVGFLNRIGGIVTGQMERWYVAGSTSDSLIFPVGTSTVLKQARVRFSTAPTTAGRIGLKYIDNGTGYTDLGTPINDGGYTIDRRLDSYWLMTGTFLTGGLIDVAFDGNGTTGITDPDNLRVIWSNNGTTFSTQGTHKAGNGTTGRRTGIGFYFSNFYLAGNSASNPLPVEMASLIATTIKNEVILDWVTSHEVNNERFEIQRAVVHSGKVGEYATIGSVKSLGNSNSNQSYKFNDRNLQAGTYAYRLKQIDFNGNFHNFNLSSYSVVVLLTTFEVSQNYPNPFNPNTYINYQMPFDGKIKIVVYDNVGKEVATLINSNISAGYNRVEFNAAGLSSGIYFYKVLASSGPQNYEKVFKMMLVK